jgi:hypothetical protein
VRKGLDQNQSNNLFEPVTACESCSNTCGTNNGKYNGNSIHQN